MNHRPSRVAACILAHVVCLPLLAGCAGAKQQRALAEKAKAKVAACKALGDQPFKRTGRCLVWDLEKDSLHSAHSLLDGSLKYDSGEGPVTVFLVSAKQKEQVGTYSVSHQPGYREWVDVCVVQMSDANDPGTPVSAHEVVSLDPRKSRPVQHTPEVGDPAPPIAEWIRSLPAN